MKSNVTRSGSWIKSSAAALIFAVVAASSWLVLRADVPQVASGEWVAAGELGTIPAGAASVGLPDGRVLVAGGTSEGVLSSGVTIYNPASGAGAAGGNLIEARSGHAATLLKDGRVLIAGGATSAGASFDIEIYDPASGVSVHAGDMTLARVDHAAATLKDGRVLIVGGSSGVSPLNLAEIFDPATGLSESLSVAMSTARVKATATTLLDGHVLVAGGSDGTNDLFSAELFDPASGSFFATGAMQTARSGHVAVLLPSNNQVLIAGGMSEGAAVDSAELYADWRDGFSNTPNPMSAARAGGIAGGLKPYDLAFVGGGGATTGEYYGYATVKTDREDYWPGEPVTVTGSGWQPGETVTLTISEDADTHFDFTYSAIAEADGTITNAEFAPIQNEIFQHFGKRFYVSARGAASEALNTFTDGNGTINGTIRNSMTNAAIGGATIACSNVGANPCNSAVSTTSTATGTYSLDFNFNGNSTNVNITVSAAGFLAQTQLLAFTNQTRTINWNLVPSITATTLSVAPVTGTYGGNTSAALSATLTAGGNGVSGKTISFTLNGTNAGSATTNGSGIATLLSASSLTGINVGSYSAGVAASFTADATYSGQTASNSLTVSPAVATVTANAKTKTYGAANPALDAVVVGAVGSDALNYSLATTALETSGVGSYPVTVTLGTNANYTVTKADAALTVSPAVATVTANAKTKTYGAVNPVLDAVVVGAVGSDPLNYSLATTALPTSGVGSYPVTVTLGTNANYTVTKTDSALEVTPAVATVTANAKTKTYGAANPALDAVVVGAVGTDALDYSLATTALETSGVGSYPVTVTLGTNANYTVTKTDSELTVSPAVATVTANAKTKTYGATNPALDAVVVGAVGSDTLDYTLATTALQTSGVGSYPVTVTLGTNANYTVTKADSELTVSPAVATVTANAKTKTYGAANPALDAVVVGAAGSDTLDYSLATTALQTSGVGSYPVTVTLGTNPNYTVSKTDATLTVDPAVATVTANAKSKTYGAANPTLDAVVVGAVGSDTLDYSLATTALQTSGVGPYPVTVTLGTNPNYTVTKTDGELTVSPAVATVTANAKTKTYGAANPTLDAVVVGAVGSDTLDYSLATTALQTSGVGPYPVTVTLGTNPNYTVTKTDGELTVSPAVATVTANAKTKTYGAANPTLDAVVVGAVGSDTLDYSLATTALQTSGVGPYPVTVTLGTNPNYTVSKTDATLTVDPAVATVTANAKSKTYGAANPTLDAVVVGAVGSDTLDYSLATTALQTSGVGPYPVTVTLGTNPNYTVSKTDAVLTVNPAVASVTAIAKSKTYGAANPDLDATVVGAVGSDVLNYTLATTALQTSGVGSYPVTVTLGTNPNYTVSKTDAAVTVSPAVATVTANAKSRSYGAVNPALDAVVVGAVGADALDYSLATTALQTSGVGSYPVTVTLGTNANYTVTKVDATLTVSPAVATVTANAKSRSYGAVNPALDAVVVGAVGADALDYSLATTALQTSGVGGYPVTVTLGTNANYTVTKVDATLTVSPAVATVTANAKSKFYGDANPALDATVTGTANGDVLNYTLATAADLSSGVGSYAVTVTLGTNTNYTVTPTNGSLTVGARAATVTANDKSRFYGDANPALDATVTGTANGDVLAYTLATTANGTSGVGTYPVSVTLGVNANYTVTPTNGTLTVGARAAAVTANDKSRFYGDANPALDATVTGTANGDVLAYTLATTANGTSGVGSYPVSVTLGVNANYTVTPTNGTLTVGARAAAVTANDKSRFYGDANPALDATVTGTVNGDVLNYTLATAADLSSGVGSHAVTVTLGTNTNYTVTPTNGTLTVGARAATVTANDKSRFYGDANPTLDATVTGTANGDVLAYTLATTANGTSGVGSYPVSVTLGVNANYTVTPTNGALTVGARAATVTANAKSKFYGDANPALDATVTGTANGDVLNYTLATTADATSGIGPYAVTVTLAANPNYTVTPSNGVLTVGARAATVTANAKSKFYGDANPALDATVTGTANGDVLNYTLATAADLTSGVGPYAVTVSLGTNANYTVTPSNGVLTVGARAATVTANAKSKFYGDANPALDATVTGTANGDVLNYTLATAADLTSSVGPYAVTVSLGTNANYTVTPSNGVLTVGARAATVTANAKSKFYGDANPALDATVTGTANGDVLNYTLATAADLASGVGPYAVTVTLGTNPNYTVTPTNGVLTVEVRTATVTANAKSKFYGDANPALDATVTGTANGDVLNYTLATTADATSGIGPYAVTVTLGANANYTVTPTNGVLTVEVRTATVTANAKSKFYGDANPTFDATVTGTANGDVLNYSLATTADATSGIGPYAVTVTLGANANYTVTPTNGVLTVEVRTATVTANAKSKFYGDTNPTFDATVTGTANGDLLNYSLATTADATSGIGPYAVTVTLAANPNYTVTPSNGVLTVGARAATVTANAKSKVYGDANPALDATVTGTANGDVLNYTLATEANLASGVGSYAVTVTLGVNANYAVTKTDATVTVTKAALAVTTNAATKIYGAANPGFAVSYATFVNGDTAAALSGTLAFTTAATAASAVGGYDVMPSGLTSANYAITFVKGTLTVNQAALTVTTVAATKIYGAANPGFAVSYATFVNGDTAPALAGTLAFTTAATAASAVGGYDVTPSGLTSANYAITFVKGTLTVNKATLTVTAENKTKLLNEANPTLTASYTGFVNGETLATSGVTLTPSLTTTAVVASPVGQYPITAGQGTLTALNYTFVFVHGNLKVFYDWDGFLQPINDTAHDLVIMSKFKTGQTIPAKFDLKDVNGVIVQQTVSPTFNFARIGAACGDAAADTIELVYQASTLPIYTLNGGHYQYNWSTKGVASGLYRIFATLNDNTTKSVDICLAK